jgi:GMP synthase (glutamine-hydrolysing)
MQIFNRPPFPGPGNFLRVVNIHVDRENLAVVQWVEARVRELCAQDQRYCDISQTVVAVIGRAVGVKGDQRVFGYMVGIRGVITKDFMTAEGVAFEPNFQKKMSQKLCEHPLVVQVGFFPTDKPPGTTEFE